MIHEFQGYYRPFSNFWTIQIEFEGDYYPSTENAYQAAKCANREDRQKFFNIRPSEAKALGKPGVLPKRKDWHEVNLQIMYELNKQKFEANFLKSLLLSTGDEILQEGNTWGDTFWGVCNGKGENNFGKILMRIRSELRNA